MTVGFVTATRKVLEQVEDCTGYGVEIVEDFSIPVIATIATAVSGVPFHLIRINPRFGSADYVVAFQCGFILRQAALSPPEKWAFGPSDQAVPSVRRMMIAPGGIAAKLGLN